MVLLAWWWRGSRDTWNRTPKLAISRCRTLGSPSSFSVFSSTRWRFLGGLGHLHRPNNSLRSAMIQVKCGGGSFLACQTFGRMSDHSFPACAFFFFLSSVEISSHTLIPLFRPGLVHNGSASRDDSGWVFPDTLCVSLFPDRLPHYAWTAALSAHSDFIGSRAYTCLGVTCHLHFWQNDWVFKCATVVEGGWNRHQIRVST